MLAAGGPLRIEPRVQDSLNSLDLEINDVRACLCVLDVREIHKEEPDETVEGKQVYVFRTRYEGELLYVKVSIRLPKDHDLKVLSFKHWGE